jgi:hypothetical protein
MRLMQVKDGGACRVDIGMALQRVVESTPQKDENRS